MARLPGDLRRIDVGVALLAAGPLLLLGAAWLAERVYPQSPKGQATVLLLVGLPVVTACAVLGVSCVVQAIRLARRR